jgi:hypothetical protein
LARCWQQPDQPPDLSQLLLLLSLLLLLRAA